MTKPVSSSLNPAQEIIAGADWIVSNTPKLYSVSLFVQSIFDGINYIREPVASLAEWSKTLTNFADFFDALRLISYIKDMVVRDEKGELLWDKAWTEICENLCWASSHAFQTVTFLNKMKVFQVSSVALTALNTTIWGLKMGACVFSIGNHSWKIHNSKKEQKEIGDRKKFWNKVLKDKIPDLEKKCEEKIDKLEKKIGKRKQFWNEFFKDKIADLEKKYKDNTDKLKIEIANLRKEETTELLRLDNKLRKWEFLKKEDKDCIKNYAKAKKERCSAKNSAEKVKQGKSWVTIAFDIAFIALLTFLIILQFAPLGGAAVGALLIALPIVVCALDVTNMMVDRYWQKSIPTLDIDSFRKKVNP